MTPTEIVVEDGQNLTANLPLIKVARKLRTANRVKICVEDEHGLSGVEADVLPPANAFEHEKELAEGP